MKDLQSEVFKERPFATFLLQITKGFQRSPPYLGGIGHNEYQIAFGSFYRQFDNVPLSVWKERAEAEIRDVLEHPEYARDYIDFLLEPVLSADVPTKADAFSEFCKSVQHSLRHIEMSLEKEYAHLVRLYSREPLETLSPGAIKGDPRLTRNTSDAEHMRETRKWVLLAIYLIMRKAVFDPKHISHISRPREVCLH